MEIYERIRHLRKYELNLSQAAFGGKLGVSRDVINNIENNRLANPDQKEPLYKLICKEFHVNESWLRAGEGDPFILDLEEDENSAVLAHIERKDPRMMAALRRYNKLSADDKELFWKIIDKIFEKDGD